MKVSEGKLVTLERIHSTHDNVPVFRIIRKVIFRPGLMHPKIYDALIGAEIGNTQTFSFSKKELGEADPKLIIEIDKSQLSCFPTLAKGMLFKTTHLGKPVFGVVESIKKKKVTLNTNPPHRLLKNGGLIHTRIVDIEFQPTHSTSEDFIQTDLLLEAGKTYQVS